MLYKKLHLKSLAYSKSIYSHVSEYSDHLPLFDVFWLNCAVLRSVLQIGFRSASHGFILGLGQRSSSYLEHAPVLADTF